MNLDAESKGSTPNVRSFFILRNALALFFAPFTVIVGRMMFGLGGWVTAFFFLGGFLMYVAVYLVLLSFSFLLPRGDLKFRHLLTVLWWTGTFFIISAAVVLPDSGDGPESHMIFAPLSHLDPQRARALSDQLAEVFVIVGGVALVGWIAACLWAAVVRAMAEDAA